MRTHDDYNNRINAYNDMMNNAGSMVAEGGAHGITSYDLMRQFYETSLLAREIAESIIVNGSHSLINLEETDDTDGLQIILSDNYMKAYKQARIYSRVFGWSIIIPVLDKIAGNASYEQPLTATKATKATPIKFWHVLTPLQVTPSTKNNRDIWSKSFGLPESFIVLNSTGVNEIHADNVVIVADERIEYQDSGEVIVNSVLEYCREPVERYEQAMTGICGGEAEISKCHSSIARSARRMNQDGMFMIDAKNGELTSRNAQLGEYTQIIGYMRKDVSGAANIPESMLFSGGLISNGAGGDMERVLVVVNRDRESKGKVVIHDSFVLLERLGYKVPTKTVIHSLIKLDATEATEARLQMQADTSNEQQMFDNIIGGVNDE